MPTLVILDPEMMKEVLSDKLGHIQKPPDNPHIKIINQGLSTMEGDKWTNQRKLITPALHLEKLKGMTPAFLTSCIDLIERWKKSVAPNGSCELDAWPDIQTFTGDVISRTAFGSSFEERKKIFKLQKEQTILVMVAVRSLYIPSRLRVHLILSSNLNFFSQLPSSEYIN
ncbi:Cytochrome p450 [Thalictrum thalictroides]|uniref:Cytochrome p450 n=1 Tax=Thalictrum thalictroides TaxID=46969 RepID=A0A7J6VUW6_THATH|nr:Cytochrome p450 [Thalictrum thalictroides]